MQKNARALRGLEGRQECGQGDQAVQDDGERLIRLGVGTKAERDAL